MFTSQEYFFIEQLRKMKPLYSGCLVHQRHFRVVSYFDIILTSLTKFPLKFVHSITFFAFHINTLDNKVW